jgi:hypothetical protein
MPKNFELAEKAGHFITEQKYEILKTIVENEKERKTDGFYLSGADIVTSYEKKQILYMLACYGFVNSYPTLYIVR